MIARRQAIHYLLPVVSSSAIDTPSHAHNRALDAAEGARPPAKASIG